MRILQEPSTARVHLPPPLDTFAQTDHMRKAVVGMTSFLRPDVYIANSCPSSPNHIDDWHTCYRQYTRRLGDLENLELKEQIKDKIQILP